MRYLLLIAFLLSASACLKKQEETNLSRVAKEAKDMLMAFHKSVNAEGLMAEFDYLDSTEAFYWTPPGYTYAIDYDSVRNILITSNNTLAKVSLQWDTFDIHPLTQDYCNYTGLVHCTMIHKDSSVQSFKVLETGTLVKRKGAWKFLSGQSRTQ